MTGADYIEVGAQALHDRLQKLVGCNLPWAKLPEEDKDYARDQARVVIEACRAAKDQGTKS